MAIFISETHRANTTLSIEEESTITADEHFEHITQQILKLSPAKAATFEQWMKHNIFESTLEVFTTYYHDSKYISEDSSYVDNTYQTQTLFQPFVASITLLICWTQEWNKNIGDLVPQLVW